MLCTRDLIWWKHARMLWISIDKSYLHVQILLHNIKVVHSERSFHPKKFSLKILRCWRRGKKYFYLTYLINEWHVLCIYKKIKPTIKRFLWRWKFHWHFFFIIIIIITFSHIFFRLIFFYKKILHFFSLILLLFFHHNIFFI